MVIENVITGFVTSLGSRIAHLHPSEIIIFDLAVILILATILAMIAKSLKQPLIPAYVLAGLVIGPLVLGFVKNVELIQAFSEIGIAFLLFTAGLEISFRKIKEANIKKIALIAILQMVIIFGIAFALKGFLDLTALQAAYIGVILAFGSTMVDIKLLADSGEIVTLHGRLVLGILLFQDLIAIIAIVVFTTGGFALAPLTIAFSKLLGIVLFAMLLQKFVLGKIFRFAARSSELLFLSSLGVLFLFVILAFVSEISIVIGAFIAGVSLANSPFKIELESRISPLRDFFAILFFVALGMQIIFAGISTRIVLFIALLVGAFIVKPFVTFALLRFTGYRQKTSFETASSLAQLSEFSLIIGMLGVTLGVLDMSIFSTVILATIISMSITPYFIGYKEAAYKLFRYPLSLFKFLPTHEVLHYEATGKEETLLIGAHRVGGVFLRRLLKNKEKLLVVDYNPEIIKHLIDKKVPCIYGEITSPDLFSKIATNNLKTVISTIPNYRENAYILKVMKEKNPKARVIVTGARISETLKLYKKGADYVITPKILAGEELSKVITSQENSIKKYKKMHLKNLKDVHKTFY